MWHTFHGHTRVDGSLSVRVADFGLTRDIYETDYYRQSQQGRVPVKWMAPESLHDRISNEKTDVVSWVEMSQSIQIINKIEPYSWFHFNYYWEV